LAAQTKNEQTNDGNKVKSKTDQVREYLLSLKPQIQNALARTVKPEYIISVTFSAIRANPQLLECSPVSLANCVLQASQLGLMLDPTLGEAYMVPFKNRDTKRKEATFMMGYRGLVKLGYRSNEVKDITAYIVYENDRFEYQHGSDERLLHIPADGDRGKMKGSYAQTHLVRGGYIFEYMSKDEIDKIRSMSKAKDGSAWTEHYEGQARKTPLRHIFKFMPNATADIARAVELDERATFGVAQALDIGDDGTVGSAEGWDGVEDATVVSDPEKKAEEEKGEPEQPALNLQSDEKPLLSKEDRAKFVEEKLNKLSKFTKKEEFTALIVEVEDALKNKLLAPEERNLLMSKISEKEPAQ